MLSNAIKYSNENTLIEIKAKRDFDYLSIEIKDQGIGIPTKDQAHIFERFYTLDRTGFDAQVSAVTGNFMSIGLGSSTAQIPIANLLAVRARFSELACA